MKNKIVAEIAVGVILLIAIMLGGLFWIQGQNQSRQEMPLDSLIPMQVQTPVQSESVAPVGVINQKKEPMAQSPVAENPATALNNDFKIYQDQKYGFQFQYPGSWGSVDIFSDSPEVYNVSIQNGEDRVQISKIAYGVNGDGLVQNRESYLKEFNAGKYEKIVVAGGLGYYFLQETLIGKSPSVYLVGDKEIFLMSYAIFDSKKTSLVEIEKIFKQIIGTFQFIQ